jgi:hypothetical protein
LARELLANRGSCIAPWLQESPALKPLVGEWLAQIPAGRLAEVSWYHTRALHLSRRQKQLKGLLQNCR